jgi:hypothetical protein
MSAYANWRGPLTMTAGEAAMIVAEYKAIDPLDRLKIWETDTADTFIYFMRVQNFVKIGLSNDVDRRRRQIQGANPHRVRLLLAIRGNVKYEEFLHASFHEYHVRGEWFELGHRLRMMILNELQAIDGLQSRGKWLHVDKRGLPL